MEEECQDHYQLPYYLMDNQEDKLHNLTKITSMDRLGSLMLACCVTDLAYAESGQLTMGSSKYD